MPIQQGSESLTPREFEQMQYEERMFEKQAAFNLEMANIEAKWASWLKIPITLIKLPVYIIFAVAYCISVARKHDPGDEFWKFIR